MHSMLLFVRPQAHISMYFSHNRSHGTIPRFRQYGGALVYVDPVWQNMLLFPWMDEEALLLSEVYTAIEIESLLGSGKKRQLKDYREIFKDIKSEGTRILVKGDPGIGKTTFTHKVAFDWATGCLDLFDVVLVVKLKLADCNQTIESLVKDQLGSVRDNDVTDSLIGEYLRSGQDRVLLVLDGLDEINLRHYPNIQDVLNGKSFRKCCILATTRPYVARELKGKMTSVAHLKGFSRLKAEKFITHIIIDQVERKRFFTQLDRRRMSHMHKVPLIVQALALLFNEDQELPETFTTTYDELVFFLRKTCEESKGLTEEEIRAAMDEVNQLAFKGLTRDDKQLVFSRDEVKNDNIYKLGLLSAEKTGGGFRPTTVLQFAHATIQENCGADHVVRRLEANDRGPWNTIVQLVPQNLHNQCRRSPRKGTKRYRRGCTVGTCSRGRGDSDRASHQCRGENLERNIPSPKPKCCHRAHAEDFDERRRFRCRTGHRKYVGGILQVPTGR